MAGKTLVLALVLAALVAPASGQQQKQVKQILHFSDVHLNLSTSLDPAASAAIPIRYYSDAPVALLEAALAFARDAVAATPDVLLYTGDHAAHGDFSDAFVASAVRTNVGLLEKFFPLKDGPGLEATAVIGNADGSASCYCVSSVDATVTMLRTCVGVTLQTRTTTWR
jgi:3',5'-cyclic AMP phosphodiesterase CpdA